MSTRPSTPSRGRTRPSRAALVGFTLTALAASCTPQSSFALEFVFDQANYVQNTLAATRFLTSLANEAQMLVNQARQLAASPYSHAAEVQATLRQVEALSRDVRGLATSLTALDAQFRDLYPLAEQGLSPGAAQIQAKERIAAARATAQDLARIAAELERLGAGREARVQGALSASSAAQGETSALQSSTQMLAVLAEDLGTLRTVMLAQARAVAEETARRAADRSAAVEMRRQFWAGTDLPRGGRFDPFPGAQD